MAPILTGLRQAGKIARSLAARLRSFMAGGSQRPTRGGLKKWSAESGVVADVLGEIGAGISFVLLLVLLFLALHLA